MTELTATTRTIGTQGATAAYSFDGRVLRVHWVRWPDGRELRYQPAVDLGVALEDLPRDLWVMLHSESGSGTRHPRRPDY